MRFTSDVLLACSAVFLLGSALAVSRWAGSVGKKPQTDKEAEAWEAALPDAFMLAVIAVLLAFVGLIVRVW